MIPLDLLLPTLLAGAAAALVPRTRPGLRPRPDDPLVEPDAGSLLTGRLRPLLAGVCGLAVAVFFGGTAGLVAGVIATGVAWRALGRLEPPDVVRRRREVERDLPGAVDLLVATFRGGAAPSTGLRTVGEAFPGAVGAAFLARCRRLDLGADPVTVWRDLSNDPQLGPLGRALLRGHLSGASVVDTSERLAEELREQSAARVEARARSVSTRAAAPLGLCFLPAFILLGIVPLVAGLLGSLRLFA